MFSPSKNVRVIRQKANLFHRQLAHFGSKGAQKKSKQKESFDIFHRHDRTAEDAKRLSLNPLSKARPHAPEYDHVRRAISKAKSSDEILKLVHQYKNAGDITIIAKAMRCNTRLLFHDLSKHSIAQKQLFEMWDMIDKDELADPVPYGILLDCCNKLNMSRRCHDIMLEMIGSGIPPNVQTLSCMLISAGKDVNKALEYWRLVTTKYNVKPDQRAYCSLFTVFGEAKDTDHAESMFIECPYHDDMDVCAALLNCFAYSSAVNKMEIMLDFMKERGMQLNDFAFQAIIIGYIMGNQPKKAIEYFYVAKDEGVLSLALLRVVPSAYIKRLELEQNYAAI